MPYIGLESKPWTTYDCNLSNKKTKYDCNDPLPMRIKMRTWYDCNFYLLGRNMVAMSILNRTIYDCIWIWMIFKEQFQFQVHLKRQKNGWCSLILVPMIQMSTFPTFNSNLSTLLSLTKLPGLSRTSILSLNKISRYLILRHREYNNDITDVRKIDLQGRSYDPTESHKLGSFSRKLHNMAHFRFIVSGFLFPVITNRSPIY